MILEVLLRSIGNGVRPSGQYFLFVWPFLAYQAIYQYYYRDEETETFDNTAFNIDNVDPSYTFCH